ncbi:hypothetical protein BS47DRAFT_1262210, partial [Hydnum rufescens UP504]
LISLPNLRIIDYVVGHTGSTHDSTCFQDSCISKEHESLFSPGEWIWADSAYPVTTWCVPPYWKPYCEIPQNQWFNTLLAHIQIKSEHTVGYLKSQFASL